MSDSSSQQAVRHVEPDGEHQTAEGCLVQLTRAGFKAAEQAARLLAAADTEVAARPHAGGEGAEAAANAGVEA